MMKVTYDQWNHTEQFEADQRVKLFEVYNEIKQRERVQSLEFFLEDRDWIEVNWAIPPTPQAELEVEDAIRKVFGDNWGVGDQDDLGMEARWIEHYHNGHLISSPTV
jgi:hypothetical protein